VYVCTVTNSFSILGVLYMQGLRPFVAHPVTQTRATILTISKALPADAATRLLSLRELHVEKSLSVSQVQAAQCLSCLTSLTVMVPSMTPGHHVLQPTDLPPKLQVLGIAFFDLYSIDNWLPALARVGVLQ
jgi:hypothetical protein